MASDPRARIMAHMNKEHGADLERYLRAFNGVPAAAAAGARLTDLSLGALRIETASGARHEVAVTPAMGSFADARVRLVDMAERAQAALGEGEGEGEGEAVQIKHFEGPGGAGLASFLGVALYFASAAALASGLLRPGTPAWALLDARFPYGGADTFAWLVRAIGPPVAAIHLSEAWWMARTRLAPHGVRPFGALWFAWVLETFVEGYPAFVRFDGLVRKEREKRRDGAGKEHAAKH